MESAIQLEKEQQRKKKHPPGLYLLFFTEMWKDLVTMDYEDY